MKRPIASEPIRAHALNRDWWAVALVTGAFMKAMLLLSAGVLVALAVGVQAQSSHEVSGYTKRDGTYVAPHYQTDSNSTRTDNWSSRPNTNTNPYTGQPGTVDPYAPKPSDNP